MRTVFYGTPELAVPFLELLSRKTSVVAVVTQPDKPAGRSLAIAPSPVKTAAIRLGLSVLSPEKPADALAPLGVLKPDLAVAVAYGKILPREVLSLPTLGSWNIHFSLLPLYRGAAPVQWSLAQGATQSGVTLFWMEPQLDAGPIFLQRETAVSEDEDAVGLFARLGRLGLGVLEEALDEAAAGRVRREPQRGEPTFAARIRREDARLSLERSARENHNRTRAMVVWPTAYLELKGPAPRGLKVLKTRLAVDAQASGEGVAGRILRIERGGGILVQCQDRSALWLLTVQPEGKKPVGAADFLNGLRLGVGDLLPLA